jgi:hypothetical protein
MDTNQSYRYEAAGAAHAAGIDDARCPAPTGLSEGYGRKRFAQTFKAKQTGQLTPATVQLSARSDRFLNRYSIEIRRTSRKGKPTGTVFASFPTDLMDRPRTTPRSRWSPPSVSVPRSRRGSAMP